MGGEIMGGSTRMMKKTDEKTKVLGRLRCIYIDCKRRQYVKVKGTYKRLVELR